MKRGGVLLVALLALSLSTLGLAQETDPEAAGGATGGSGEAPAPSSAAESVQAASDGPQTPSEPTAPSEVADDAGQPDAPEPPAQPAQVVPAPPPEAGAPRITAPSKPAGPAVAPVATSPPPAPAPVAPAAPKAVAVQSDDETVEIDPQPAQGANAPADDTKVRASLVPEPADASAGDEPANGALYDRLLGEPKEVAGTAEPPTVGTPTLGFEGPSVPSWLWVLGIAGGIGLLLLRSRSLKALGGRDAIRVVSRAQVGKDGLLAVVEVEEADGEQRRLLVGFGGGAPRLVADLGRPFPDEDEPLGPVVQTQSLGPRPAPKRQEASANAASAWARAVQTAVPDPATGRLERRHDLIREVLAEREDDGPSGGTG